MGVNGGAETAREDAIRENSPGMDVIYLRAAP